MDGSGHEHIEAGRPDRSADGAGWNGPARNKRKKPDGNGTDGTGMGGKGRKRNGKKTGKNGRKRMGTYGDGGNIRQTLTNGDGWEPIAAGRRVHGTSQEARATNKNKNSSPL